MNPQHSSRSGFMILMLIAFTSIILGLSVTFYSYCKRSSDSSAQAVKLVNQRLALAGALQYITTVLANPVDAPVDRAPVTWGAPTIVSNWGNPTPSPLPNPSSATLAQKIDPAMTSPTNPFNKLRTDPSPVAIVSLRNAAQPRTNGLGWFRVSYPYMSASLTNQQRSDLQYYFSSTTAAAPATRVLTTTIDSSVSAKISADPVIIPNCLLITVGCGPSRGTFSATTRWQFENISWYLVELYPKILSTAPYWNSADLTQHLPGSIKRVLPILSPPQNNPPVDPIYNPLIDATRPYYW
jgi:hypothetical protein